MPRRTTRPFMSGLMPRDALAEQTRRTHHQHEHEDRERDDVLPLVTEAPGADGLDDPEREPADEGAADVPNPTVHGGGERLDARDEPDVVARRKPQAEQEPGDAGEHAADQKRRGD